MTYQAHFFGFQKWNFPEAVDAGLLEASFFSRRVCQSHFPWVNGRGLCCGRWGVLQKHKQRSHDFTHNRWIFPFTHSVSIPVLQIKESAPKSLRFGGFEHMHLILLKRTGWCLQAHRWKHIKKNLETIVSPLMLTYFALKGAGTKGAPDTNRNQNG